LRRRPSATVDRERVAIYGEVIKTTENDGPMGEAGEKQAAGCKMGGA
jgi:hypothetical protein